MFQFGWAWSFVWVTKPSKAPLLSSSWLLNM